jgi:hypothetical protein
MSAKRLLLIFWGLVVIFILAYTDLELPDVAINSDYISCVYPAAKLVSLNRLSELYPPLSAVDFADAPFDQFAHSLLPKLPETLVAWYAYAPIVAMVFCPLSQIPAHISLLIWQLISILALIAAIFLTSGNKVKNTFWYAFLFLPLVITLWIGQLGVVFGILVLAAGYHFAKHNRFFIAGLIWSLCLLKLQYFIVPFLISIFCIFQKKFNCMFGIISGAILLTAINFFVSSPDVLSQWLHVYKITDLIYANPNTGVPQHLVLSLPRTILLHTPIDQHTFIKPIVYALSSIIFFIAIFICYKIAQSRSNAEKSQADNNLSLTFITTLALVIMPLVLPYLFYYDLSIMFFGFLLILNLPNEQRAYFRRLVRAIFIATAIYALIFLFAKQFAHPILLLLVFAIIFIRFFRLIKVCAASGQQEHSAHPS